MAGIYLHIPFCKQKCTYCDFYFSTNYHSYEEQLISALLDEIVLRKKELVGENIESIYFGGGTPSLLNEKQITLLLEMLRKHYKIQKNTEITLEANPDDIEESKVKMWQQNGINRLSIGIQSFFDEDLRWMKRAHTAEESILSVKTARKHGFDNINIDLIYGLPNMDLKRWEKQIHQAIALNVQHISAYCLTIEEKTELHHLVKNKKIAVAGNSLQAEQFFLLQNLLKQNGFIQYEISNFGKPGFFSGHNSSYWKQKPYIGIGPSAHSFDLKSRSWNVANSHRYIKQLEAKILPATKEDLSPIDCFNEYLLTGLRTIWGVNLSKLEEYAPITEDSRKYITNLLRNHEAEIKSDTLILTEKGFLVADKIASDLFIVD